MPTFVLKYMQVTERKRKQERMRERKRGGKEEEVVTYKKRYR